jgi:hypothetical protein
VAQDAAKDILDAMLEESTTAIAVLEAGPQSPVVQKAVEKMVEVRDKLTEARDAVARIR